MSDLTLRDYLTAAKVLDHLNRKLGYTDDSWWSPDDLSAISERVPAKSGREQIELATRVIRDMQHSEGLILDDRIGYCASAIRGSANQRWQVVDFATIEPVDGGES
ncbi:hypothetical protein ACPXB3_22265 [Gordonia sp. DT219]|uniref:hypothetical protein n=1 Tax=Gordonia sp. DT219 TaxID=3416658 RepID=UPI003CF8670F